ncbi:hypothetical protein ACFLZX_03560 [Nanoarchaeota archaeon]
MIDEKNFQKVKDLFNKFEKDREQLIGISREVVRLSKQLIYAIHRDDTKQSEKFYNEINKKFADMKKLPNKNPLLSSQGSLKVAIQEYVEAIGYYEFRKTKKLPKYSDEYINVEYYLSGLCDLVGELTRKATYSSINQEFDKVLDIRVAVEKIYEHLLHFDFRNSDLRRSFDGLKYEIKKVNDLVLELQLKGKL